MTMYVIAIVVLLLMNRQLELLVCMSERNQQPHNHKVIVEPLCHPLLVLDKRAVPSVFCFIMQFVKPLYMPALNSVSHSHRPPTEIEY